MRVSAFERRMACEERALRALLSEVHLENGTFVVRKGSLHLRITCSPQFPFRSPSVQVAASNRDAVIRALAPCLGYDMAHLIHEKNSQFEPLKEFLSRRNHSPSSIRSVTGASDWSPVYRIVDIVMDVSSMYEKGAW